LLGISTILKKPSVDAETLMMLIDAVDCLPIGITLSDVSGKIIYANPAKADMHGNILEELIGKVCPLFFQ
jgi:PAS domain-containing protein